MSSLITETIREILMEEQQVCLPGIGTLRLTPKPAVVSPIEGKATPPSNQASFNSNLVLDDGKILRSLKEIPILTDEEANKLLQKFLQNISDNLDAGRSVTLEGIGRLFKHFDGEVRFTAGGENFSKESFGLPPVELKPIARSEKVKVSAVDPMLAPATAPLDPLSAPASSRPTTNNSSTAPRPQSKWEQIVHHPDLRQILWYITAIFAAIAIVTLGYLLLQTVIKSYASDPVARITTDPVIVEEPPARIPLPPVDADRIVPDEPPRLNETRARTQPEAPVPFEQPAPATTPTEDAPSSLQDFTTTPPGATPPATAAPAPYNTAYIAVGLYGSSANVTKNKGRINKAGYEAFSRQSGRYTRVGVRVRYTNRADLMETLRAVQQLYDDAFVMEINGEAVKIK